LVVITDPVTFNDLPHFEYLVTLLNRGSGRRLTVTVWASAPDDDQVEAVFRRSVVGAALLASGWEVQVVWDALYAEECAA
jgi:hypothetical protein